MCKNFCVVRGLVFLFLIEGKLLKEKRIERRKME